MLRAGAGHAKDEALSVLKVCARHCSSSALRPSNIHMHGDIDVGNKGECAEAPISFPVSSELRALTTAKDIWKAMIVVVITMSPCK